MGHNVPWYRCSVVEGDVSDTYFVQSPELHSCRPYWDVVPADSAERTSGQMTIGFVVVSEYRWVRWSGREIEMDDTTCGEDHSDCRFGRRHNL